MRRIFLAILCVFLLALPVSAVSGISSARSQTVVDSDGSCQVSLTLTLQLDSAVSDLVFPLPAQARDITVNGQRSSSTYTGSVRNMDLSGIVTGAGTYTLTLQYSLPDAITADAKDNLTLTLELLSGFAYPIDQLEFSITLPGEPEAKPVFTSVYYQQSTDSVMDCTIDGAVIRGSFTQRLQDHETLTMTLSVTERMFPQSMSKRWSMDTVDLVMIATGVIAILYWIAAMRCRIPRNLRRTTPPEGITAGELGCHLTGQGADLTMMVVSWAQLGYILIQPDDNGRVLLHKRMDMGNERSDFENRYFRSLFGRRQVVDGTGYHYAKLCRKAKRSIPGRQLNFLPASGNPLLLRILAAFIGTLSGISLAQAYASDTGWQIALSILLGIAGSVIAWLIQSGAMTLHRRDKLPLWIGLGGCGLWYILSYPAGEWNVAVCVILAQILAGLAAGYSGRRTETGMQTMAHILGLRRYLKTISKENLKWILSGNPSYYYDIAPYALALDADRALTRQIGSLPLPECTYLTTGMDGHMTAKEWDQLLRDTVHSLDALQKRLPLERFIGK